MLGCDFETFLYREGALLPAEKVLPGHKYEPFLIGGNVQGHPDNIMAEVSLVDPCTHTNFAEQVRLAHQRLQEYVGDAVTVTPVASVETTKELLDSSACSREIGCDPDYDAEGNMYRYAPRQLGSHRFAGFHIHFDVSPMIDPLHAAQVIDCTIGLASIAKSWDAGQGKRRSFYGGPGRHRPKPYGIEYRSLSPAVLGHLDELQELINIVAPQLEAGDGPCIPLPYMFWDAVSQVIREEDIETARKLYVEVMNSIGESDAH